MKSSIEFLLIPMPFLAHGAGVGVRAEANVGSEANIESEAKTNAQMIFSPVESIVGMSGWLDGSMSESPHRNLFKSVT